MAVELRVLGPVRVATIGEAAERAPLTQPRPLALLAYLALARPPGPRARETLISLLWPESDHATGRQGLRNALYRIRAALGPDLITTSGDALVGVDASLLSCDAWAFEKAIAERRWADALRLYQGDLLEGTYVGGAPEFDRWVDDERDRFRNAAAAAVSALSMEASATGDHAAAVSAARRACDLLPYDEHMLRQLVGAMAAAGDRAGALLAYEAFAERLARDLEAEPSAATVAAIEALRSSVGSTPTPRAREAPVAHAPPDPERSVEGARSPLPAAGRTQRIRHAAAVLVAIAAVAWLAVFPFSRSASDLPAAAALDPAAAALSARWRADTAHLAAYLRAHDKLGDGTPTDARFVFGELVREAPLFAPAWGGYSVALYRSAFHDVPPRTAMARAVAAANRALALDPSLPEPMETLIAYDLFYRWDLESAKARLDSALARHPEYPEFHNLLATWHRFRGELDVALELKRQNAERDPLTARYTYQVASSLYFAHRCEEAEAAYRRLPVEIRSAYGSVRLYRSLACQGKLDEAAAALREAALLAGDTLHARMLEPPLTPETRARAIESVFRERLEQQLARRREAWSPPELVMLQYAELQNADSTLLWLDSMYAERSMMLYVVPFDPLNDFLRDDPPLPSVRGTASLARGGHEDAAAVAPPLARAAVRALRPP